MNLRIALLLSAVALFTLGCEDLLRSTQIGTPVPVADLTGVTAYGTVVQTTTGAAAARLDVLTLSGEPRFLSGIANPALVVGQEIIPLTTGTTVGTFTTSSQQSSLDYAPATRYQFSFELIDDAGETHAYSGSATAPSTLPVIESPNTLVYFVGEPVFVELLHMAEGGSLRVTNAAGEITYDTTTIQTLPESTQIRARMEATVGPTEQIPGTAFPSPGTYVITVTSLQFSDAVSGLASTSWFAAGATDSITVQVQ